MKQILCPECGEALARDLPACPACGESPLLHGRYRLEAVLGSNVGTTYLAHDEKSSQPVVIKELAISRLDSWKTEELFMREVSVLKQLDHPAIPKYLDHFVQGQGKKFKHFLVQQFFKGRDLRREMKNKRYNEQEVLKLLEQVLAILIYLQDLRPPLIHRDIKPSNLLRLPDGNIALIDFGAVRDLVSPQGDSPTVAGTFGFMAPEQFRGDAYLQTDLYALGAVALHLLSRVAPEKMLAVGLQLDWREHVSLSRPMEDLLERLLTLEPAERPESARKALDLARATRQALSAEKRVDSAVSTQMAARERPLPAKPGATAGSGWLKKSIPLTIAALITLVIGGLLLFDKTTRERPKMDREKTSAKQPSGRYQALPVRRYRGRAESEAPPGGELALELSARKMTQVLLGSDWSGSINGKVRFRKAKKGLEAFLIGEDGERAPFSSVTLGDMATLVLIRERKQGAVTIRWVYNGALTADKHRLRGMYQKIYLEGRNRHVIEGGWFLKAEARAK